MEIQQTTGSYSKKIEEKNPLDFDILFKNFSELLYNYADYYLNDMEASKSVVNDTFLRLWNGNHRPLYVKPYLYRSVKNACFTYLASKKHQQSLSESIDNDDISTCSGDNPEQLYIFSEVTLRVNKVIGSLPLKCQMVFRLIKEEGLSYKEVSKVLEISQNTIETHMRIALRKIRMDLQQFLK